MSDDFRNEAKVVRIQKESEQSVQPESDKDVDKEELLKTNKKIAQHDIETIKEITLDNQD
jgi:hypothetical protein